jgi:ACR3 family arsenite efflux pump ArsB
MERGALLQTVVAPSIVQTAPYPPPTPRQMAEGDAEMCAVMVALNSALQIVLYAPLSILYLRVVSGGAGVDVGFWPVARSVLLFLGVPLVGGILLRVTLIAAAGRKWFDGALPCRVGCAVIQLGVWRLAAVLRCCAAG